MSTARPAWIASPWLADATRAARIEEGYRRQHERRARLASCGGIIGWKIGGNDAGTRARWGIENCVYGYLPAQSCHVVRRAFDIAAFACAAVEPELWIEMTGDLHDPLDAAEVESRIGRIGLAAELVDVAGRIDDVESVLAGNIFHAAAVHSATGIAFNPQQIAATRITVMRDDQVRWRDVPVAAFLPDIRAVVSFVGASLALVGERLRAGERIMSGVLTPLPIWVRPGNEVRIEWSGIDALTLSFAAKGDA